MQLKLFRSTGYSSILAPGETRFALHPLWSILAISLWVGIACNMPLWRALTSGGVGLPRSLLMGVTAAAASGAALSIFGWRRTLKPVALVVLGLAAWSASGWLETGVPMLVPPVALLHWRTAALFAALILPPAVWLLRTPLRRLAGPEQLKVNLAGACAGLATGGIAFYFLSFLG